MRSRHHGFALRVVSEQMCVVVALLPAGRNATGIKARCIYLMFEIEFFTVSCFVFIMLLTAV
jgi:hypothetical protein